MAQSHSHHSWASLVSDFLPDFVIGVRRLQRLRQRIRFSEHVNQ